MMAHGYTITANCDGDHTATGPRNFEGYGHSKREAFAEMRAKGWTWRGHNCWCPQCSEKRRDNS